MTVATRFIPPREPRCEGSWNGFCKLRAPRLLSEAARSSASSGQKSRILARLLERARCRVRAGLPCPHYPPRPECNGKRRELRCRGMVRQFRRLAPNQSAILQAFQARGWPKRIEDPLCRPSDLDPEHRLRDAIFELNHGQKPQLLHFFADGTGHGICWEFAQPLVP
jgi:hypothetical protein